MIRIARTLIKKIYEHLAQKRVDDVEILFVIGTMRSGSTLLMHILNSNPGIEAVGENYLSYTSNKDLENLISNVCYTNRVLSLKNKIFVDKILHNKLKISKNIINCRKNIKLFILRRPEGVIDSMWRGKGKFPNTESIDESVKYYITRTEQIIRYIESSSSEDATFVTYDELTSDADLTLRRLTEFLELDEPLTPTYSTHWHTGSGGIGDPGDKIKLGSIVRNEREIQVDIPKIDRCRACFSTALAKCKSRLFTLESD